VLLLYASLGCIFVPFRCFSLRGSSAAGHVGRACFATVHVTGRKVEGRPLLWPMGRQPDIELFTWMTPNGRKVPIMLEELGMAYSVKPVDLTRNQHKSKWFREINPNGKIPAMIDHGNRDLHLSESGAILMYLAEKTGRFLPHNPTLRAETLQWLMFQMSSIGPMQGQAHEWANLPVKIGPAIAKYKQETERLYGVLDSQLTGKNYISGDDITIADFAMYPWIAAHEMADIDIFMFPNIVRWLNTTGSRKGVQRGMNFLTPLQDTR